MIRSQGQPNVNNPALTSPTKKKKSEICFHNRVASPVVRARRTIFVNRWRDTGERTRGDSGQSGAGGVISVQHVAASAAPCGWGCDALTLTRASRCRLRPMAEPVLNHNRGECQTPHTGRDVGNDVALVVIQ